MKKYGISERYNLSKQGGINAVNNCPYRMSVLVVDTLMDILSMQGMLVSQQGA